MNSRTVAAFFIALLQLGILFVMNRLLTGVWPTTQDMAFSVAFIALWQAHEATLNKGNK